MARQESGRGQLVETSLLQALFAYDLGGLFRAQLGERFPAIFANLVMPPIPTLNYHALQTKDGRWLQFGNLLAHLFDNYLTAVGLEDIFADPDYEGTAAQWSEDARERLRDRMFARMLERTASEWMELFIEHGGVAATPFQSTQEALDDPDLVLNGHVVEREHPTLGTVRQLGPLARLTATPGAAGEAGPEPGEHTDQVSSPKQREKQRPPAPAPPLPPSLPPPPAGPPLCAASPSSSSPPSSPPPSAPPSLPTSVRASSRSSPSAATPSAPWASLPWAPVAATAARRASPST